MSNAQKTAFEKLLAGWRHHEDLRSSGASVEELFASRQVLDEYRLEASTAQ